MCGVNNQEYLLVWTKSDFGIIQWMNLLERIENQWLNPHLQPEAVGDPQVCQTSWACKGKPAHVFTSSHFPTNSSSPKSMGRIGAFFAGQMRVMPSCSSFPDIKSASINYGLCIVTMLKDITLTAEGVTISDYFLSGDDFPILFQTEIHSMKSCTVLESSFS